MRPRVPCQPPRAAREKGGCGASPAPTAVRIAAAAPVSRRQHHHPCCCRQDLAVRCRSVNRTVHPVSRGRSPDEQHKQPREHRLRRHSRHASIRNPRRRCPGSRSPAIDPSACAGARVRRGRQDGASASAGRRPAAPARASRPAAGRNAPGPASAGGAA